MNSVLEAKDLDISNDKYYFPAILSLRDTDIIYADIDSLMGYYNRLFQNYIEVLSVIPTIYPTIVC